MRSTLFDLADRATAEQALCRDLSNALGRVAGVRVAAVHIEDGPLPAIAPEVQGVPAARIPRLQEAVVGLNAPTTEPSTLKQVRELASTLRPFAPSTWFGTVDSIRVKPIGAPQPGPTRRSLEPEAPTTRDGLTLVCLNGPRESRVFDRGELCFQRDDGLVTLQNTAPTCPAWTLADRSGNHILVRPSLETDVLHLAAPGLGSALSTLNGEPRGLGIREIQAWTAWPDACTIVFNRPVRPFELVKLSWPLGFATARVLLNPTVCETKWRGEPDPAQTCSAFSPVASTPRDLKVRQPYALEAPPTPSGAPRTWGDVEVTPARRFPHLHAAVKRGVSLQAGLAPVLLAESTIHPIADPAWSSSRCRLIEGLVDRTGVRALWSS